MESEEYLRSVKGEVEAEFIAIKEEFITEAENKIGKKSLESIPIKQEFTGETTNDVNNYTIYEIQELQKFENDDVTVEENSSPKLSNLDSDIARTEANKARFFHGNNYTIENNHYICLKCSNLKKFKNRAGILRHIRREHFGIKYKCPECKNTYWDRHPLKQHLVTKHNFNIAKLKSSSITIVETESSCIRDETSLDVTAAETAFDNANAATKIPYEQYYEVLLNCFVCLKCTNPKKFKSRQSIIRHIGYEHFGLKYTCPECKKDYWGRQGLKTHLRKEHHLNIDTIEIYGITNKPGILHDNEYVVTTEIDTEKEESHTNKEIKLEIQGESYGTAYIERTSGVLHCEPKVINEAEIERLTMENHDSDTDLKSGNTLESTECQGQTKREEPYKMKNIVTDKRLFSYKQYYKVQGDFIICLKCTNSKKFKFRSSVNRHIRLKHFGVKFRCPKCKHKFVERYQLKTHLKNCHDLNINKLKNGHRIKLATAVRNYENDLNVNKLKNGHRIKLATAVRNYEKNVNVPAAKESSAGDEQSLVDMTSKDEQKEENEESHCDIEIIKSFPYEQYFEIKENIFFCLKCTTSKEYKFRDSIVRHLRSKHSVRKHICPECKNEYVDEQSLKKHFDLNHKVETDTLESNCLLKKTSDLNEDILENTEPKTDEATANTKEPTDSPSNDGKVTSKTNKMSLAQYYAKQGINFICLKCVNSVEYKCRGTVIAHLLSKHFGLRYCCPECGKDFLQKRSLKDHLTIHHKLNIDELKTENFLKHSENPSQDNNDNYQQYYKSLGNHVICLKCIVSKEYSSRTSVIRHIRNEHFGLKFSCPECKTEYIEKWRLRKHLSEKHQLNINELDETCFLKTATNRQDQWNADDKEIRFPEASMYSDDEQKNINSLKFQSELKKKERVLYNELIKQKTASNYICLKCKNQPKFRLKRSAVYHIRTKHMFLKYICPKCQREYNNHRDFRMHMRLQHQLICNTYQNFIKICKQSNPSSSTNTLSQSFEFQSIEKIGKVSDKSNDDDDDDDDAGETLIMDIVIKDEKLL